MPISLGGIKINPIETGIKAVSRTAPVILTAGQYATVSHTFNTLEVLTGRVMYFNPGVFTKIDEEPPTNEGWFLPYPATPGTYPMEFASELIWKNHRADLEVVNSTTFRIIYRFFVSTKIGFIGGDLPPDHSRPFDDGNYGNLLMRISMHVRAGNLTTVGRIPCSLRRWCQAPEGDVDWQTASPDPFDPGKVLITAKLPGRVQGDSFVGFYRTDQVSNQTGLVDDISLKYVKAHPSPPVPVDDIPSDSITTAVVYNTRAGGASRIYIKVPLENFDPNGRYVVYVVYDLGTGPRSCRTTFSLADRFPIITGNVAYEIKDDDGNTYTKGCLVGVPPCMNLGLKVTMDAASYNAALAAAKVSGDINANFQGVTVTEQETFNDAQSGPSLRIRSSRNSAGIWADVEGYQVKPGTTYLVFGFRFIVGDGFEQTILVPVQISAASYGEVAAPEYLCAEDEDDIIITLPESTTDQTLMIGQSDNGRPFTEAQGITRTGNVLTIDRNSLLFGAARCFRVCTMGAEAVEQECNCDCPEVEFYFSLSLADGADGGQVVTYKIGVVDAALLPSNVKTMQVFGKTVAVANDTSEITGTFNIDGNRGNFNLIGVAEMENGCKYKTPQQAFGYYPGAIRSVYRVVRVMDSVCNCEDVPPPPTQCNNFAVITHRCEGGQMYFDHDESFSSVVDTDVIQCKVDGGSYGECLASYPVGTAVTVRRVVSFVADCDAIETVYRAECGGVPVTCINTATLSLEAANDTLTLTVAGDYSSAVLDESIFFSLDGGLIFEKYTTPVALDGTEQIRAYSITTFVDGCPEVVTPMQSVKGEIISEDPFVDYCDDEGKITGYALITFPAPGVIETVYLNAAMQIIPTPPPGSPCANTAPCYTC